VLALSSTLCGCAAASGSEGQRVQPPGGSPIFAPYVDVTLTAPFDLEGVAYDAGARGLTLAFITSAGECQPAWGGQLPIDAPAVLKPATRLRSEGVALRVSFGGATGSELAAACPSVERLAGAYASVLDRYDAAGADFDLEGATLSDTTAMERRAAAVARLQATLGRPLAVSLTLPVEPGGLSAPALAAVRSMIAAGVHVSVVNLLAMDYGGTWTHGQMARATILAASAAHRQLAVQEPSLAGWSSLGATIMVGVNDESGEVFTLADAQAVAAFAGEHRLGLTSIWSLARDNPCEGDRTVAQPTCSGLAEPPYAFSRAFGANSRQGLLTRRAVDTS